jgi:hypothetical protein
MITNKTRSVLPTKEEYAQLRTLKESLGLTRNPFAHNVTETKEERNVVNPTDFSHNQVSNV